MFSLPGLPPEAIAQILVYGFGFVLFVSAMARLIRELFIDATIRAKTENPVLSLFTPYVVIAAGLSMYFYVLSIASMLMVSYPEDIPNMAAAWTSIPLALSDRIWGADENTPMPLSWLGAAFLLHMSAEVVRFILGAPQRRRDKKRFNGALNSFEAQQKAAASKDKNGAAKRAR